MIHTGDCVVEMAKMPADSVDAVVTDPPYGLEFMGKGWDKFGVGGKAARADNQRPTDANGDSTGLARWDIDRPQTYTAGSPFQAWCEAWGREALRVTKPGGYLLAFGGTRTHHRLVCGLEDAGWIIRDELTWIYACLSDDTELLTNLGWVPYNRANEASHAAAFDTATGKLHWERIEAVHVYDHEGGMVDVGPSRVTLNHRVVLSPESQVPLPSHEALRRLWSRLPDVESHSGATGKGVRERVLAGAAVRATTRQDQAAIGAQGPLVQMRGVRQADVEAGRMGEAHHRADVFVSVQRGTASAVSDLQDRDVGGSDTGESGVGSPQDDRPAQPSLEGRRYHLQEARELLWGAVRARTGLGEADGPERRLRDGAPPTDGGPVRIPDGQGRSGQPREPRPDRQPPRESDAVALEPGPQAVRVEQAGDAWRLVPTAATAQLVDYAGVVWCITVPSGAFVARRNGIAFVTGNSGFPKGKANLKPAHEPIVLARKPGPLRPLAIDACRIGTQGGGTHCPDFPEPCSGHANHGRYSPTIHVQSDASGRWPSNVLLDPDSAALFDEPNPGVVGSGAVTSSNVRDSEDVDEVATTWSLGRSGVTLRGHEDSGGYSRFFLIPKADRGDREPVLRGQLEPAVWSDGRAVAADYPSQRGKTARENTHATVKPTDSAAIAVEPEPRNGSRTSPDSPSSFLEGVEQEPEYVAIAEARLNGTQRGLGLDVPAPTRKRTWIPGANEDGKPRKGYPGQGQWGQWATELAKPDEEPAA